MSHLSPMVAKNWVLYYVIFCSILYYRKEEKQMIPSFVEYLVENGYSYNEAMQATVYVFNDIMPDEIENLYFEWSNKYIVPQCMKGEK